MWTALPPCDAAPEAMTAMASQRTESIGNMRMERRAKVQVVAWGGLRIWDCT